MLLLIDVVDKLDRSEEAISLARLHVEQQRRANGVTHPKTLKGMLLLGWMLGSAPSEEDQNEGVRLLMEAHGVLSDTIGPRDVETMGVAVGLGSVLLRQCRFAEAEKYVRDVCEWCSGRPEREDTCVQPPADLAIIVGLRGNPTEGAQLANASACVRRRLGRRRTPLAQEGESGEERHNEGSEPDDVHGSHRCALVADALEARERPGRILRRSELR